MKSLPLKSGVKPASTVGLAWNTRASSNGETLRRFIVVGDLPETGELARTEAQKKRTPLVLFLPGVYAGTGPRRQAKISR